MAAAQETPSAEVPTAGQPQPTEAQPTPATPPTTGTTATTTTAPQAAPCCEKAPSWTDRISLSGKMYLRYSYGLGADQQNANEFAIDRIYLQSEYKLTDTMRVQVTLDAGGAREDGKSYFDVATKYAFFEAKDLLFKGSYLRVGQVPLAWIPYEEDLWGLRLQGPTYMDRTGNLTSADLGIAYGGKLPAGYGSFQVDLSNGEGWKSAELGKRKVIEGRLTLNPLAAVGGIASNVFISGLAYFGEYDNPGLSNYTRQRYIGQVGYHDENITLAAEYVALADATDALKKKYEVTDGPVTERSGYSLYGVLGLGAFSPNAAGWDVFARYDADPSATLANDQIGLALGGIGWRWNPHVRTILDYQAAIVDSAAPRLSSQVVQVQMEAKL